MESLFQRVGSLFDRQLDKAMAGIEWCIEGNVAEGAEGDASKTQRPALRDGCGKQGGSEAAPPVRRIDGEFLEMQESADRAGNRKADLPFAAVFDDEGPVGARQAVEGRGLHRRGGCDRGMPIRGKELRGARFNGRQGGGISRPV